MQQRTTQYLHPTKNGYKLVTRRIGKRTSRTPKKRKIGLIERFFALWLLVFTMSICYGMIIGKEMRVEQMQVQANHDYFENSKEVALSTEAGQTEPTPKPIEWKTGHATAYSCIGLTTEAEIDMNCPSLRYAPEGMTASGVVPKEGITIACDPDNMGRTFYIEGWGERICQDTGGHIVGQGRFDIYVGHVDEAWNFGRQENIKYYEVK